MNNIKMMKIIAKCILCMILCLVIIFVFSACNDREIASKYNSSSSEDINNFASNSIKKNENHLNSMQPIYNNNSYQFNPYSINNELIDEYGTNYFEFYYNFINAYINYDNSCKCSCQEYSDSITEIEMSSFPLLNSNYGIDGSISYDYTDKTISWNYQCKNKEEHISNYNKFKNKINSYLIGIKDSDSDVEKAKKIYCNYNRGKSYNYDSLKSKNNISSYYGLIGDNGICVTFSYAFNYLLNQLNIENYVVYCDIEDDPLNDGHDWNIVKLNNKYYFCDTTFQITCNNTDSLKYFGFTMNERLNDGFKYNKDKMTFGTLKPRNISEIEISKDNLNN